MGNQANDFVWRELRLPSHISPEAARACMLGLAALPGQPRIVLEAIGQGGVLRWRIGGALGQMAQLRRAVTTHLPDADLNTSGIHGDFDDLSLAGSLHMTRNRELPLGRDQRGDVARSLLAVFAATKHSEVLRLQVILGRRTAPKRAPELDGISRTVIAGKHGQHGFGCAIRFASAARHEDRARNLLRDAAAALQGLEVPGVRISIKRSRTGSVVGARSPFLWPLWLSIEDLVPLLAWPVTNDSERDLPGVPKAHPKLLPATAQHPKDGRPFGLSAASLRSGEQRLIGQGITDALAHTHVLGVSGTGKSTALAQMVLSDASAGRSAVVIDPKGDLIDDLLARLPEHRLDDVVVLDARETSPVGINPLIGTDPDFAADSVLAVCHSLWADSWGPRTNDILHASLLTLARAGNASLVMVPALLTNPGFRRRITGPLIAADPLGLGSFWAIFNSWSDEQRGQAIQPLLNKLRQVLLRPSLRAIFGQTEPRFQISDVFTKQRIFLVALGKGTIGSEAAQLLGSIVTTHLWHAITQRSLVSANARKPVMVYIDEVQDYLRLPGDLGDALAQARGLGVGFTLAHQELGQLGKLRGAVMANTRSKLIFQTAPDDARDLALAYGDEKLERRDFRALGAYQAYAQVLSGSATTPWVSVVTEPLPRAVRSADGIRAQSAARYSRPLAETDAHLIELLDEAATSGNPSAGSDDDLMRRRPKGGQS